MSDLLSVAVISKNGLRGHVLTNSKLLDDRPLKSVIFDSGRELSISSEHFHLQKDGTYYLDLSVNPAPEESVAREVPPGRVRHSLRPSRYRPWLKAMPTPQRW